MNRQIFKLLNLAKTGVKFGKNATLVSRPAKIGSAILTSSLFGLLYLKQSSQFRTFTESDVREVETIKAADLQDGDMKQVQVGPTKDDVILISKVDGKYYATGAKCSHFGAPLEKGMLFDNKVVCPLHAAAFSVKDGQPDQGPVFKGIPTYEIREENGVLHVKVPKVLKNEAEIPMTGRDSNDNRKFVIVGGGPAALSAAETLRQSGYGGEIIMISNDQNPPYDRTFLSKAIFNITLPKVNIRNEEYYKKYEINVITNKNVNNVDVNKKTVEVEGLGGIQYDKLLVATGGRPRLPPISGTDLKNVYTLRNFNDMENIRDAAQGAKNVVIIGGSFIGMETAAAMKNQFKENLNVTVVEMAKVPFEPALGTEVGSALHQFHVEHGVKFHLGSSAKAIEDTGKGKEVVLADGTRLSADLVVIGVGVRPNSELVSKAVDLAQDGGIVADKYLRTSNENVYTAGDVASIPFWLTGSRVRIEHYNEAIQQGMIAAYNMLGKQVSHGRYSILLD